MPSYSKRRHHEVPNRNLHGELDAACSAGGGPTALVVGEESLCNIHNAGLEENLLSEQPAVSRTTSNAETVSQNDLISRTSGDGMPDEHSYFSETIDRCMNGNAEAPDEVAAPKCKTANKPTCLGSVCYQAGQTHQGYAVAIVNLKKLNKQLLEQVCTLRSGETVLREKIKSLQLEFEQNIARGDCIVSEKTLLENQRDALQADLKACTEEVAKLGLEKLSILGFRDTLLGISHDLETDHSKCGMEVRQAKESLMKSMVALELAQTKAQCLELDIEPLMLEHRRLSTDVSVLQEQNSNLHRTIEQTQMEKEHLENEIKQIRDSCAALEDRCTQTSTIRHNLETKLASRLLQSEGLQMQLQGAWQQIQSLEAQQEASIADRFDLEKQIKRLENDLIAAREECEDALCMLESEREEKMSAANALRKVESEAEDLHSQFKTISVSSDNLQMSADHSFKQVASYEAKISCLLKEKEKLENTISALTNKVENLKLCSDEAFISSKKEIDTLKGKICKLEEALVAADALSHEQSKCARDLDSEVKELTTTLYRRKRLADLSIPLAVIATGSLVVFGVMCIWRRNS